MSRALRWTLCIAVVVAALAAGFTLIILSQNGAIATEPWQPLGLAISIVGALTAFMLGILEAFEATDHPSDHRHRPAH